MLWTDTHIYVNPSWVLGVLVGTESYRALSHPSRTCVLGMQVLTNYTYCVGGWVVKKFSDQRSVLPKTLLCNLSSASQTNANLDS